jgi:hypothetical protein
MSIDFQKVWNYYSREPVQRAIVEIAKNREVVSVFKDGRFGRRPDVIQYPQDVLQAVAEGTVSFHGSVERWNQPMKLDVGLTKLDLDQMRTGWDVFIDVDVKDFEIAKITTKQIIEAFKDHGVKNYSCKFTGGSSFHIGIPFEALPEKINMQPTSIQYPEILQKVVEYVKWYVNDQLKEEMSLVATPAEISKRIGKSVDEITGTEGIEPFKIVTMDIFSSRHLFRLPYSLHESSLLVSLPLKPESIERFEKEHALPEKIRIEEKFLIPKSAAHDAEGLIVEAMDWATKNIVEVKEELPRPARQIRMSMIPEEYFPPCVHNIFKGLADGRKRSIFILINFLRNMGWDLEKLENKMMEWNEKNYPSIRANYLRTQLRWHLRQQRNLLPPNCDNEQFYANIGVCTPDKYCKSGTDKITIKNPVNYPFRKMKKPLKDLKKNKFKHKV